MPSEQCHVSIAGVQLFEGHLNEPEMFPRGSGSLTTPCDMVPMGMCCIFNLLAAPP